MGNIISLLVQAVFMGAILSIPLYFALPKPRTRAFPKLVAVFVVAQTLLVMVMPATGRPGDDWFQTTVGPMILAYLAVKFTHPPA